MKIQVTRLHIQNGRKQNAFFCPIALSLKEMVYNPNLVCVGLGAISLSGETHSTPEIAKQFIEDFDAGKNVEPFSFDLPMEV